MSILKSSFSHVAFLVPSVGRSAAFLNANNIPTAQPEVFESEGTKEVYVGSYDNQSGLLLLVEGISEGPYLRAMSKRGPSLHHIAIDVLDIESFLIEAQRVGWQLHAVSQKTLSYNTAWLFLKGIPCLIEVSQKKELSRKPAQVSSLEIPLASDQLGLFAGIGLGDLVSCGPELKLRVNNQKFNFSELITGLISK